MAPPTTAPIPAETQPTGPVNAANAPLNAVTAAVLATTATVPVLKTPVNSVIPALTLLMINKLKYADANPAINGVRAFKIGISPFNASANILTTGVDASIIRAMT